MQVVVHERMCHVVTSFWRRPYRTWLICFAYPALKVLGYSTPPLPGLGTFRLGYFALIQKTTSRK